MAHLLAERDLSFLQSQPGCTPELVRQFRVQRRSIFRGYLRRLKRDFHCLHRAARLVALYSSEDRPDLAQVLARQRLAFSLALLAVEWRLCLHWLGADAVDARGLVEALEAMHRQVRPGLA
ncbi:MAG: hypothetical protein HYR60_15840 [Acidobacteria bacterium]|nr:hypothetical protein [Acidobacteriota bacterium]